MLYNNEDFHEIIHLGHANVPVFGLYKIFHEGT